MANKDSEKKQWTDPKDYGLPFVDVTPMRAMAKNVQQETQAGEVHQEIEVPILEPIVEVSVTKEEIPIQSEVERPNKSAPTPTVKRPVENKKSSTWIWAAILIGLGLVSVIVWQIQSQFESAKSEVVLTKLDEQAVKTDTVEALVVPDSATSAPIQAAVDQDSIPTVAVSIPNISKPVETGTTIANKSVGDLIKIESKAERPQYFIIVGSLPNESLASNEAKVYFGRSSTIYLILPYDEVTNYRLAIGKFETFKAATAELEKIKSNYSEALWILKY